MTAAALVVSAVLVAVAAHQPLSSAWDGATFCYPVIGAVQRIDPSLADSTRRRVQAHEDVHRADCDRRGAVISFISLATTTGRLDAEARAGCAEARQQVALGRDPWLEHERVIDELRYGYPWFRQLPESSLRKEFHRVCADIAVAGAEPAWRRGPDVTRPF